MRLFLLSILAIGIGVHSLAVGYPYRSALLGYVPARGEFPVQSSVVQGYLRYFDNTGAERLVGYRYPEPVYGVRQVSYVNGIPAVLRTYNQQIESSEFIRARDAHFRAWSVQQYEALKQEIDALRADGREPSSDMIAKYRPLEKIALTTDFSTIADLPEIRRVRDEHLRIWNEARIQNLQTETDQQSTGEIKTYAGQNVPLIPVEETPEQKLARQEHLRIYNEQLNRLRLLQEREQNVKETLVKSQKTETKLYDQPINRLAAQSDGLIEVERAREEHLRLWNEARLRTEQASYQHKGFIAETGSKTYQPAADNQVISESTKLQPQEIQTRFSIPQTSQQGQYQQVVVVDTPEVVQAREEHLRLVNEAKLRAESVVRDELKYKNDVQVPLLQNLQTETDQQSTGEIKTYAGQNVPLIPVEETPEQKLARQEHLRIYNEQLNRLRLLQEREQNVKETLLKSQKTETKLYDQPINRLAAQSDGLIEVERAREEHLRLWNEARLRTEQANYQHKGFIAETGSKTYQPAAENQVISESTKLQPQEIQTRFSIPQTSQQGQYQQVVVVDTPEVVKAREEHLRLVNEAKLRAESVVRDELKYKNDVQVPLLQQPQKLQPISFQHTKTAIPQASQVTAIGDTPEVIKAREEHLRLVSEANLKAQQVERQGQNDSPLQEHYTIPIAITETPEVSKARNEHLRLIQEANLKAQSVELKKQELLASSLPVSSQQYVQTMIEDTPEVMKAREEHLRLVNEAKLKVQTLESQGQQHDIQTRIGENPEVLRAREEHLRIFNAIRSDAEKEQSKFKEIKATGITLKSEMNSDQLELIRKEEEEREELRLLELERFREEERIREEKRQLELEKLREAERMTEEQRQMESERMRLKFEEEQRMAMERLMEDRRQNSEREPMQQIVVTEEYKPIQSEETFTLQGQQQKYIRNPYLTGQTIDGKVFQQQLQPTLFQQQYGSNPFLKSIAVDGQIVEQQIKPGVVQQQNLETVLPGVRYIQSSSQQSLGSKHQNLKDDFIKISSADHAGYQPADTAAVLIHLEKARQDHFRAHEDALERLRLARVQDPSLKDCN